MTDHNDLATLRCYSRQEAAALLTIPNTGLKVWVTQRVVPHQRSGKPGPRQRGVWFTYADILAIGRVLPDLMTGRQANSRAEIAADGTPAETPADRTAAEPITAAVDAAEEMWKRFEGLRSLRTVPDQGPAPAGTW